MSIKVAAPRRENTLPRKMVRLSDGVQLSLIDVGSGSPVVIIPGWSQSAAQWEEQIALLAEDHRVVAIDMRGHGESDRPDHGYRIARLAADVNEVLRLLEISDAALIGHSMGCSVIWCLLELFGSDRVARIILCDQGRTLIADAGWSAEERLAAGAVFNPEQLPAIIEALRSPDGDAFSRATLESMVSPNFLPAQLEQLLTENLKFPREFAARLLVDHAFKDWADVIKRIDIPTLVLGGTSSIVPWQAMVSIGEMIAGSRTVILDDGNRASHFAFLETPDTFLRAVTEFLDV